MSATDARLPGDETSVTDVISVHLWAAARAVAGTSTVLVEAAAPISLAAVVERVLAGRPERLGPVLAGCSILLGDQPVATRDPAEVMVAPGQTVEFLPPFAGG